MAVIFNGHMLQIIGRHLIFVNQAWVVDLAATKTSGEATISVLAINGIHNE